MEFLIFKRKEIRLYYFHIKKEEKRCQNSIPFITRLGFGHDIEVQKGNMDLKLKPEFKTGSTLLKKF